MERVGESPLGQGISLIIREKMSVEITNVKPILERIIFNICAHNIIKIRKYFKNQKFEF